MMIPEQLNAPYDMRADKGNEHLIIEVKTWFQGTVGYGVLKRTAEQLLAAAEEENGEPTLVVAYPYPEEIRERLSSNETIKIIDVQNLLDMTQGDIDLENRLQASLNYSLYTVQSVKPSAVHLEKTGKNIEDKKIEDLIKTIESWEPQENKFTQYENTCVEVLKCLFSEDLDLWREQQTANDGLYRSDLICKIHNGNQKEFWNIAERHFNSKYIVFEFKNHKGVIRQNEVVLTAKYLYPKALRNVAILISANGADKGAEREMRGNLRNDEKLMIGLSNLDLINMLRIKADNEDPSQYLSDKLGDILIDLEK